MRIVGISNPETEAEHRLIHDMHRLRARIFCGRLAWNVRCTSGLEIDSFDELKPTYILCIDRSDAVIGCARLLPATSSTMLKRVFPQLLESAHLRVHARMIESSRFCVDTEAAGRQQQSGLHTATLAMFAGIVEWSILNGYSEILTATDVRLERILRRAGWPLNWTFRHSRCRRRSASGWGPGWADARGVESTVSRPAREARGFRCLIEEQSTDSRLYRSAFSWPDRRAADQRSALPRAMSARRLAAQLDVPSDFANNPAMRSATRARTPSSSWPSYIAS
ncbi:MAG: hypothetical protein DI537_55145 [Stutzerimonas stutzeri]|nr:MAG: hypothetical protein DI537_55145 [Stutzerimonas stutzeri]